MSFRCYIFFEPLMQMFADPFHIIIHAEKAYNGLAAYL